MDIRPSKNPFSVRGDAHNLPFKDSVFSGDDFYRYTPLAFERLLAGFRVVRFNTPFWVFSVIGLAVTEMAKRTGLGLLERPIHELAWRLDRLLQPSRQRPRSFAAAYLIVAIKEGIN